MLHGLTRNSRDFENVAARYAGDWRVLAVDFRGRGLSQYDANSANYAPRTYAMDIIELLDELDIERAVFLGTSLGGLVTMTIAKLQPQRIAGAMLNDIGPELDQAGIERIRTYVGKPVLFRDWDDAASQLQTRLAEVHPSYGRPEWRRFAKRICRESEEGVEFDYDMAIAEPFNAGKTGAVEDPWPYFHALSGRPVLVLRAENSDLLPRSAAERMAREIPDVEFVTIPRVGHAPDLDEPEAVAAIDRLLERVLAQGA
jgi:pimeloyl-ACP methyl ester carboxylesterase